MALRRVRVSMQPDERRKKLAPLVVAAFHKHRNDSSAQLADRLGLGREYVRVALRRANLSTRGRTGRKDGRHA
jgi:hypothetical protein